MPESPSGVVVAGIDGSRAARSAAGWAAADAQLRGATLQLIHAVTARPDDSYPEFLLLRPQPTDRMRSRARMLLQSTTDTIAATHPGLRIEIAQKDGAAVQVLLEQSRRGAIATVVGADGDGRMAGAFFGSVTARLAAHGRGCIVVARPEPADTINDPGVIAVGVDGSAPSRAAIAFPYEEAALRGATLLAIHSWNDKPLDHALGSYPLELNAAGVDDRQHQLLETELSGWEQKYPDVPVQMRVLRGRTAPALLRCVSAAGTPPVRLIVVGSRGRGGFVGLLLGSTSQAVMTHAACCVAVVHGERGILPAVGAADSGRR